MFSQQNTVLLVILALLATAIIADAKPSKNNKSNNPDSSDDKKHKSTNDGTFTAKTGVQNYVAKCWMYCLRKNLYTFYLRCQNVQDKTTCMYCRYWLRCPSGYGYF
ncbi:uncharacterized protein LOC120342485 [Styela clava]